MLQLIALTQFVFIALGSMAVTILVKTSGYPSAPESDVPYLSLVLMRNSVWVLLLPIIWLALAVAFARLGKGNFSSRVTNGIGIVISMIIFVMYAVAIVGHY